MLHKITEMRGFLLACQMTDALLPEQIALLSVALDVLEAHVKTSSEAEYATIAAVVEARSHGRLTTKEG